MAPGGDGFLIDSLATRVKAAALDLGFATCGISDLSPTPHAQELDRWLADGMAGSMGYMPRQAAKRKAPGTIIPGATRAVVVTRWYPPDRTDTPPDDRGRIASYARGPDYHETLARPLEQLASFIRHLGDGPVIARPYVDAGPVPERELAQRAGLGWIGKNTMLIDPRRGSYCFLASVLTDLDLPIDAPFETDRCGSCRRCLDACPTNAFPAPRVLDANRCISYLTIEWRGELPPALASAFDGWVFGCDACQSVCPWNEKFAVDPGDPVLGLTDEKAFVDLRWMATVDDHSFNRRFGDTPLARPGPAGMRRNARARMEAVGDG